MDNNNWRGADLVYFLKKTNCRVSDSSRWLYWDKGSDEWVVLSREPYQKVNRTLYKGNDLGEALETLEPGWQK